jgi:hypothetical protein
MRKYLIVLMVMAVLGLLPVTGLASIVDFSTVSVLNCTNGGGTSGCGTNQVQFGGVIMTFVGVAPSVDADAVGTYSGFGYIAMSCIGGGTSCGSSVIPVGMGITLTINQSSPPGGSPGNIPTGTFTGSISGKASSASMSWNMPAGVQIFSTPGPIEYSIVNSPLAIVPPSIDNCGSICTSNSLPTPSGLTTIQGYVRDASVPEPGTWSAGIGFGMIALGLWRRRSKSQQ